MQINVKVVRLSLAVFFAVSGIASAHNQRVGPSATITFELGAAVLSANAKAQLESLVSNARKTSQIDEIEIAVWSDNPTPRSGDQLSKVDRDLADRRARAVREYLKSPLKVSVVDAYNMAERASWLARILDTNDAQVKAEMTGKELLSREHVKVFKDNGKPSAAVVVILLEP